MWTHASLPVRGISRPLPSDAVPASTHLSTKAPSPTSPGVPIIPSPSGRTPTSHGSARRYPPQRQHRDPQVVPEGERGQQGGGGEGQGDPAVCVPAHPTGAGEGHRAPDEGQEIVQEGDRAGIGGGGQSYPATAALCTSSAPEPIGQALRRAPADKSTCIGTAVRSRLPQNSLCQFAEWKFSSLQRHRPHGPSSVRPTACRRQEPDDPLAGLPCHGPAV